MFWIHPPSVPYPPCMQWAQNLYKSHWIGCPWYHINLDISNIEYLFLFFQLRLPEEQIFEIQHVQCVN